MRTITVGDIHGCLDEFDMLMKEVEYKQGTDRLVLLGDLIDRGPDPAGVIKRAIEIGAECVKGNHEEKALRWLKHEKRRQEDPDKYKNPMAQIHEFRLSQWAAVSDEDWKWVESLPCYLMITPVWAAAHAGVLPGAELEDQLPNDLMRVRYVKEIPHPSGYSKYKMCSPNESGECPEMGVHWITLWKGPKKIVYGHYTYFEGAQATEFSLGIDTGCVHGRTLTAAIFTEDDKYELAQVQAKQMYAPRKAWNEE